MNEMNEWERQLRSWTPRRPSGAVEARLWPVEPRRAARNSRNLAWLVPATACFLFACLMLNQHSAVTFVDGSQREIMAAVSLSNQSYAAYMPNSYQPANNRLDTFEWTNTGGSTSPMHFASPQRAAD